MLGGRGFGPIGCGVAVVLGLGWQDRWGGGALTRRRVCDMGSGPRAVNVVPSNMSKPAGTIEETGSMLELLQLCRQSPTETERLRAKATGHMEEIRKSIQDTVARTHTESLLAALTHEQQRRLNQYTEEPLSDFGSYHRYILSIAIARGLPGQGPSHSAMSAMHAMLSILPELYETRSLVLSLDAMQSDDSRDSVRVDHIHLARIQSEFETDVRLGHHEMQFIRGIFELTDQKRLVRLVGFSPAAAEAVIQQLREIVEARVGRALDAGRHSGGSLQAFALDNSPKAYRIANDEIAATDEERAFVEKLSVAVGETAMELPWPKRDAPVRRRTFLRCETGEVMALNLGGREHSIRAYIEQQLAAHEVVFQ